MSPDVPFTTVTKQHTHCVTAVVLCCHCAFHIAAWRYCTHLSLSPSINSVPCCSPHSSNKAAHTVSLLLVLCCHCAIHIASRRNCTHLTLSIYYLLTEIGQAGLAIILCTIIVFSNCSQLLLGYPVYSKCTGYWLDWSQLAWELHFAARFWRKDRGKDTGVLIGP